MSWGQLRLQLQTAAPGVPLDLLDEYLNSRYEQVLEANAWVGVETTSSVVTTAAHESTTDTATFTVGQQAVTGSGTNWDATLIGRRIYRKGDAVIYTVSAVGSTTSLTLDRPYEGLTGNAPGTVYAAAQFVLMQNLYALPADCGSVIDILNPVTGFPLERLSMTDLDQSAGTRTRIDDPTVWALRQDSSEAFPPVVHQIELYPPPRYARSFPLNYRRSAYGFDGQNTAAGPLPWVSGSVLMYGCRADIATYLAGSAEDPGPHLAQARMYESKFAEELARLIRIEHQQRRKQQTFQMADRFTRHRLERAARGMTSPWRHGDGGPN